MAARPLAPIKALAKPLPPPWDYGTLWSMKVLDGDLPPLPRQSGGDPCDIWPRVEAKLGRGIGQSVRRFFVACSPTNSRVKRWHWPTWWDVQAVDPFVQTYDDEGNRLDLIPRDRHPSERLDGLRMASHFAYMLTVRIDGDPAGADEFVEAYRVVMGNRT